MQISENVLNFEAIQSNRRFIPDWHHSEGDIFRAHIVSAFDFIDFIGLRHNNAMML